MERFQERNELVKHIFSSIDSSIRYKRIEMLNEYLKKQVAIDEIINNTDDISKLRVKILLADCELLNYRMTKFLY